MQVAWSTGLGQRCQTHGPTCDPEVEVVWPLVLLVLDNACIHPMAHQCVVDVDVGFDGSRVLWGGEGGGE